MVSYLKTFAHKGCNIGAVKIFLKDFFYLFTPIKPLFVPTSQNPMPKLFRFSESLAKTNGKKWYRIVKLLLIKDVKSPRKKIVFCEFCFTSRIC